MERDEIVEYKERIEEDDDEYDEVGKLFILTLLVIILIWK